MNVLLFSLRIFSKMGNTGLLVSSRIGAYSLSGKDVIL